MSGRDSSAASQRARKQALEKLETLCYKYLSDTTYTLSLPDLLGLRDALPKIAQPSVWDAVSEQAMPGLLSIYITLIRRSSPLLQPCSATEAQLQESVRALLSEALGSTSDVKRTLRLVLAILRSQSLCCYAVLMADAAASLSRQRCKRAEDTAAHLMSDLRDVVLLISTALAATRHAEADSASRAELLLALATELTASSLLEHWARLLLTLASCEGSKRALELAASHLQCLCYTWGAVVMRLDPDCVTSLLAASPCLSYLFISQLVALCAALDGGTVYGIPEAPGRALLTAVLPLPMEGRVTPMDLILTPCMDALGVLPEAMERQLQQQAPDVVSGSTPAAFPSGAAAAANTPAAASTPETAGLLAAAAGEGQEAEQERLTALQQPTGPAAGPAAAAAVPPASTRSGPAPTLLLDPTVCLEISLRLPTALSGAFARKAGSALVRQEGGVDAGSRCAQLQRRVAESVSWGAFFGAVNGALGMAAELLRDAPSAAARLRHRGLRDSRSGGGASAAAAPCAPSSALSPVERWWQGAVAVGDALAAAAKQVDAGKVKPEDDGRPFSGYFEVLDSMMSGETRVQPPAEPSESVAAALSAGFLPCLERLLRAALPLNCKWDVEWGGGWDAAWAQMLVFADAGQLAAVIDAAAEGLRVAVAAAGTSSGRRDGGTGGFFRAVDMVGRLDGSTALDWLYILSGGPSPKPGETETLSSTWGALGYSPGASCSPNLLRLGGSLSLIAARLLPELSRAILGGLLPAFHRGDVDLSMAYFYLKWQLYWVPILAAALAAESVPTPAAANGSADGGVVVGSGGVSGGVGAGGGRNPRVDRWRQLLFVELRLPGLLGAALGLLTCQRGTEEVSESVLGLRNILRNALLALAALVPGELARMVAAADRAEAAAAGRGGAASAPLLPPPSSGLLQRALGPGGPLEEAEVLAAVEAACAGRGAGAGAGSGGSPSSTEQLMSVARVLSLQG